MKRKKETANDDKPVGRVTEVPDFLPPPHELARAKTTVVVTIGLDPETIAFFKKEAKKNGTKYQKMIREVLHRYAHHFNNAA